MNILPSAPPSPSSPPMGTFPHAPAIDPALLPLVGEFAWHSLTVDPRIADISRDHYALVRPLLSRLFPAGPRGLKVLEVACYAHTTGYDLARNDGCDVTLFELSAATLRLGRTLAGDAMPRPRLVIGDFHALPFADGEFDFVYISSALHHTWDYARVARELLRVVRPGGALFFENEPCLREACFYKFRCDRQENFTRLEQHLWDEGWLRTFAEPYVGSRPETLFGMIENQRIPLYDLLALLRVDGNAVDVEVTPEICMSPTEHAWLAERHRPLPELVDWLATETARAVKRAWAHVGPVERGLGFSLPDPDEIGPWAHKIAGLLHQLPDPRLPEQFRPALAHLFGAAVRVTVVKSIAPLRPAANGVPPALDLDAEGIFNGFPRYIQTLLSQRSQMADLQCGRPDLVTGSFDPDAWRYERNANGVWTCAPKASPAPLRLPRGAGTRLFILRAFCGLADEHPYRIALVAEGRELAAREIHHTDSHLFLVTLPESIDEAIIDFRPIGADPASGDRLPPFTLAYCGLFALPPAERELP